MASSGCSIKDKMVQCLAMSGLVHSQGTRKFLTLVGNLFSVVPSPGPLSPEKALGYELSVIRRVCAQSKGPGLLPRTWNLHFLNMCLMSVRAEKKQSKNAVLF